MQALELRFGRCWPHQTAPRGTSQPVSDRGVSMNGKTRLYARSEHGHWTGARLTHSSEGSEPHLLDIARSHHDFWDAAIVQLFFQTLMCWT